MGRTIDELSAVRTHTGLIPDLFLFLLLRLESLSAQKSCPRTRSALTPFRVSLSLHLRYSLVAFSSFNYLIFFVCLGLISESSVLTESSTSTRGVLKLN